MVQEKVIQAKAGLPRLIVLLLISAASIGLLIYSIIMRFHVLIGLAVLLNVFSLIAFGGLKSLKANEARVLTLFGDYYGTLKGPGYFYVHPLTSSYNPAAGTRFKNRDTGEKKSKNEDSVVAADPTISLKRMTLDNNLQKVNDLLGNPVEIRIAVIWRVKDTAKAVFNVDNYLEYLALQSDSALRDVVRCYPYDKAQGVDTDGDGEPDEGSLRGSSREVAERIRALIRERVEDAGLEIIDARITHLSYAPEIAKVMLQRQQAGAIVDARKTIVDGAVGMTEMALHYLEEHEIVDLNPEQRAKLVSNLLVVLCGNKDIQPVVGSGAGD